MNGTARPMAATKCVPRHLSSSSKQPSKNENDDEDDRDSDER